MTKRGLLFLTLVLPLVVSGCSEPALQPAPRAGHLKLLDFGLCKEAVDHRCIMVLVD